MAAKDKNTPPGPGVDASGQAVMDPTVNVKERVDLEVAHLENLRATDRKHSRELRKLSAHYEKALRKAEAKRIGEQFKVLESNRVEQKTDTKVAVDAALSAAKEAVGKNEIFVKEQLAQGSSTTGEQIKAQGDKLDELKTRFERSEQFGAGGHAQVVEARAGSANSGLWIGLAVAAALGLGTLVLGGLGLIITAVGIYLATRP